NSSMKSIRKRRAACAASLSVATGDVMAAERLGLAHQLAEQQPRAEGDTDGLERLAGEVNANLLAGFIVARRGFLRRSIRSRRHPVDGAVRGGSRVVYRAMRLIAHCVGLACIGAEIALSGFHGGLLIDGL